MGFILFSLQFSGMDLGKLLRISQKQKMGKQGICIRTVCNNLWSGGGDRLRDLTSGGRKHPGTLFCRGGSRYDSGIRDRCTDGSHFSHQLVGLQR